MTKLEGEILRAISGATRYKSDASPNSQSAQAKAAAEVAKKYIEKAIIDSVKQGWDMESGDAPTVIGDSYFSSDLDRFKDKWLKENGIE